MAGSLRLLVPLDRLDGRRHTFGTYLTGWLRALAPHLDGLTITRKKERSYPFLEGFEQVEIPAGLERGRAYSLLFPLWSRSLPADIVHFPYRFAPYSWWGLPAAKVVTVHDTALLTLSGDMVSKMRRRTFWRYKRSLAAFDAVVTVSRASREELIRHFDLPKEKITVIPHGVEERFTPGPPSRDLASRYGVRAPFILNVSSIKKKKNIDGLVRAFAKLKKEGYPHQLVLVGKADSGIEEVLRLVEGFGLEKDVLLTGFVDEEDHPDFYRQAQIMVYPSFYEGFGLPILEAMACGCPVITSRVSSMPEVAGEAALLIDPGDVDSIAEAMRELLNGPQKRESLISRGRERAGTFTWKKSAESHLELYNRLL